MQRERCTSYFRISLPLNTVIFADNSFIFIIQRNPFLPIEAYLYHFILIVWAVLHLLNIRRYNSIPILTQKIYLPASGTGSDKSADAVLESYKFLSEEL